MKSRRLNPDRETRIIDRAFFALVVFYLVPIWLVRYVPTQDGPSHVYNAYVIRHYHDASHYPRFQQVYGLHLQEMPPNVAGHLLMATLMVCVAPLIAEKILLSIYVAGFLILGRRWILAVVPQQRIAPLLLFPLVYNYLLQMGLYNFCLGVVVWLWGLVVYLKHEDRLNARRAAGFTAIAVLCFFCHLVACLLLLLVVAVLLLLRRERTGKQRLREMLYVLPACALPAWHLGTHLFEYSSQRYWHLSQSLAYLARGQLAVSFSAAQAWLGMAVGTLLALLIALSVFKTGRAGTWPSPRRLTSTLQGRVVIGALVAAALYCLIPESSGGGLFLHARVACCLYLLVLPCLDVRVGGRLGRLLAAAMIALAVANGVYLVRWYTMLDRELTQFSAGVDAVQRDSRVMALVFDRFGPAMNIRVFLHAVDHYCIEKAAIDWGNYEAATAYFPVRFLPQLTGIRPSIRVMEMSPDDIQPQHHVSLVDHVITWAMPDDSPVEAHIESLYVKTYDQGRLRVYTRRELGVSLN